MPSATARFPLHEIAQRINHHERELADLRKEYEARQTQLTALARRKEELEAQLKQIDAEISNVDQATTVASSTSKSTSTPSPKSTSTSPPPFKSAAPKKRATGASPNNGDAKASGERISLPKLLVRLVQRAKKPVSIKELVANVVAQKYPTKAKDLHSMVANRVTDLVKAKALKRVADQPGVVVLGKVPTAAAGTITTASVAKSVTAKESSREQSNGSEKKLSLKQALIQVLAKSSRPLKAQQLADKVVAAGYETQSKDFKNVVWVIAGRMDNIENVKGEGYRLKAGNAITNKKKG